MRRNWWIAATIAILILVGGCRSGGHAQNSTDLRFLNAVADAEALDVLVDDDVKTSALALGSTSGYSEFGSGSRDVKIRSATNGSVLVDKSLTFNSGSNSTLVMYGRRAAIATLVLTDDTTSPSSGHFKVRAVGLAPDSGAVDLYVVSSDITATPATIGAIGYGVATDYIELTPGSFRIVLAAAGTKDIVFQSTPQSFAEGAEVTVGVFPAIGGKLVNGLVLTAGSGASGTYLANPSARLKAVNAVPDSTALNFKADGTLLLSNVPFLGSSSYVTATTGAHALQVDASNVPGATIASVTATLDPARDYTALAVNNLAQVQLVALPDDNTLAPAGFAKLRFANAFVASGAVDVLVNFASQATNITFASASGYYPLAATLTGYSVTFATPGGVSVIASLDTGEIDAGGVYTVYLFGAGNAPQARLVRDR